MSDFVSQPLARHHDRLSFRCGAAELDDYLQHRANQDVRRRAAAVFVLVPEDQPQRIAGFYSLSSASIILDELPAELAKALPRYPLVPAVLLDAKNENSGLFCQSLGPGERGTVSRHENLSLQTGRHEMKRADLTRRQWLTGAVSLGAATAVSGWLAPSLLAADTPQTRARNRAGETPRPIVAVDNVCAWPNLTVLRDGTVIATIFNQPSHGLCEGDVECWGSEDGGRTWALRGTPATHDRGTNRMNVAAGLAANGDLLVIASGWSHRPPPGQTAGHGPPAQVLAPWVCRSADGGRSWSIDKTIFPNLPCGGNGIPFGDILAGQEACLRVFIYLASWRTYVYRSTDDAKTWTRRQRLTGHMKHPGDLLRLNDGRLLLTYGNRTSPGGIDVQLSDDEGHTWTDPWRVADCEGDRGYPSSIQLPDGQVLTAFYAQRTADHNRYHMGVVHWDPASTEP
jgi:hypothetical protein